MKIRMRVVSALVLVSVFIISLRGAGADESAGFVKYDPPVKIESLGVGVASFDDIDRTNPEKVLYGKTVAKTKEEINKIYAKSVVGDEIINILHSREITPEYHELFGDNKLLWSFLYEGAYGPPMQFCFVQSEKDQYIVPVCLEKEDGVWCQQVDSRMYPVIIALYDLGKEFDIFRKGVDYKDIDINSFQRKFENIDINIAGVKAEHTNYYNRINK